MATTSTTKGSAGKRSRMPHSARKHIWLLVATTLLIIGSLVLFMPPQEKINQGLDIQGGLSVVLTATSTEEGGTVTDEDMETSRSIIESRVNALGASEAVVQVQGTDQILVQIPGLSDTQVALETIGKTGKLEFARLDSFTDEDVKSAIQSGNYGDQSSMSDDFGNSFQTSEDVHLKVTAGTYEPIVTGDNIERVTVGRASETSVDYAVDIVLDSAGADAFYKASQDLVGDHGQIVIILDGEVQSAPAVQSEIPNGQVQITGGYDLKGAQALQTVLESGSLPVSFQYSQSQVVGPTLGQDALASGVVVALLGLMLVMLYLLFFYKGLGLLTAASMLTFAILYLGILAGLSSMGMFSLTLSGVAGIVITLGMAADSSVLVLERFREEIRMGRSIKGASQSGVKHAIMTSIDADSVSFVAGLTLFFLASASVKGFGFTLALGVLIDVLVLLLLKGPLVRLLAPKVMAKNPGFWDIKDSQEAAGMFSELGKVQGVSAAAAELGEALDKEASEDEAVRVGGERGRAVSQAVHDMKGRFIKHDFDFMGKRKIFFAVSAVLIVCSIGLLAFKGLEFGIEFVGGSSITFYDTGDVSYDEMRDALNEAGEEDATLQTTVTSGAEGFLVRTTTTDPQEATATADDVAGKLGLSQENYEVTTIGPDWGSSVIQASLLAFFVALALMIVYLAIRFEWKMGTVVVVALLHDLIILVGIYALFGREITPNVIAAVLSILFYGCYDSVISLHRINDNMQGMDVKCSFMTMANHSLNQVIVRTLNTTITSMIPVLFMLAFGSETLQDFAFAIVAGLILGCYSSIGIATPLFAMWKESEPKYAKLRGKFGDAIGAFEFNRSSGLKPAYAGAAGGGSSVKADDEGQGKAAITTASGAILDPADPAVYQTPPRNPNKGGSRKDRKRR